MNKAWKVCEQVNKNLNILAAFLIVLIFAGALWGNPNVSVRGYEVLTFKAGEKTQRVNLHNPETNSCYMKLTLIQDVVLWSSELIEPGGSINEISLARALGAGTYNATLKHEFFSLDDKSAKSALNGLNISLKLRVE